MRACQKEAICGVIRDFIVFALIFTGSIVFLVGMIYAFIWCEHNITVHLPGIPYQLISNILLFILLLTVIFAVIMAIYDRYCMYLKICEERLKS